MQILELFSYQYFVLLVVQMWYRIEQSNDK